MGLRYPVAVRFYRAPGERAKTEQGSAGDKVCDGPAIHTVTSGRPAPNGRTPTAGQAPKPSAGTDFVRGSDTWIRHRPFPPWV